MREVNETQRVAWQNGGLPATGLVADGIWAVAVPCPPFRIRFTFCYLVADGPDVVIVDPGLDTDAGWHALLEGIALTGHTIEDVRGVVVTHFHPDHISMAARVADASGCWVAAHEHEIAALDRWRSRPISERCQRDAKWLRVAGVPERERDRLSEDTGVEHVLSSIQVPDRALVHGDTIKVGARELAIVHTPGHTPGHVCVVDLAGRAILTGDHVLPRISPNVGLHAVDQADEDPVSAYLGSLTMMSDFDDLLVLPAHEYGFDGLRDRADELAAHHTGRADEILAVLTGVELTPWEISERITWSRPWSEFDAVNARLALAETLAHVRRLESEEEVVITDPSRWRVRRAVDIAGV